MKLQPAVLPRYYQNVAADPSVWAKVGKFENPPPADGQAPLRPGFDPAESYLHDLAVRKQCPLVPSWLLTWRAAHLHRYGQVFLRPIRRRPFWRYMGPEHLQANAISRNESLFEHSCTEGLPVN